MAATRAAVVIGVNRTGQLDPLESAVATADGVADWLRGEGFKVVKLTDATKPVTAEAVRKAVTKFVDAQVYQQLVLYFSGHGFWKNDGEFWLLSGAPRLGNEAVNFVESVDLARLSGIPNVVLISDACRTASDATFMRVRGSAVFPNNPDTGLQPKVDRLQASRTGAPAYEVQLPTGPPGKVSIFTHCLRKAFTNPDATMVLTLQDGQRTIEVVPLRRLEGFLRREVPSLLSSVDLSKDQQPVVDVSSDEPAYLARVRRPPGPDDGPESIQPGPFPPPPPPPPPTVEDIAQAAVAAEISPTGGSGLHRYLRGPAAVVAQQFRSLRSRVQLPPPVLRFESQTGFTVSGTWVRDRVASAGGRVDAAGEEHPSAEAVRIWLDPGKTHCSVAITFGDGTGIVLPALQGYLGHITVAGGGVTNVSYIPSEYSTRWESYLDRREEIDSLRSAVAAAASLGVLRLRKEDAENFADRVRVAKQFDPTLGVYAAYAYAQAGLSDQVHSVREFMYGDLGVSLFDVAMLDRGTGMDDLGGYVPSCPLLSQGWNYLRARGVELPKVLADAEDQLAQSLWTTFNPEIMTLVSGSLAEGGLLT